MHENVALSQKVQEKQQRKKPAQLLDKMKTFKNIDGAVDAYNKGRKGRYTIKQAQRETLKRIYGMYIMLYNRGSTHILQLKKILCDESGEYNCPRFATSGAGMKKQLGMISIRTFDNHINKLKESGFLERGTLLQSNKIRKSRTNSSCITLLRPELLKYKESRKVAA